MNTGTLKLVYIHNDLRQVSAFMWPA